MIDFDSRKILVTGATGYFGKEICHLLASLNAHVIVNGRDQKVVSAYVNALNSKGYEVTEAVFDVSDIKDIERWVSSFDSDYLSGIVHNAYAGSSGSIETASSDDFFDSYQIGLVGVNELTRLLLPQLGRAVELFGDASVVSMSSMYGKVSPDLSVYESANVANPPFYGATKAALVQWSKYAACEFGKKGIRFNTISPGPFPNLSVQELNPKFVERLSRKVPLGRIGRAEEIGGPVAFLLSPMASFITGADLDVNGGWTAW